MEHARAFWDDTVMGQQTVFPSSADLGGPLSELASNGNTAREGAEDASTGTAFIELHTERLILRDHRPADLPSHHRLLSDARVMHYLPDVRSRCIEDSASNLQNSICQIGDPLRKFYYLRVEEKLTGAHVGEVGYTVLRHTPLGKLVSLGYFTRSVYWGCEYTPEAVWSLLHYAFTEDGVYRISAGCLAENKASERVMQKCLMKKEGEFKEFQWHNGRLKDRVEYRMLATEWWDICGQVCEP